MFVVYALLHISENLNKRWLYAWKCILRVEGVQESLFTGVTFILPFILPIAMDEPELFTTALRRVRRELRASISSFPVTGNY